MHTLRGFSVAVTLTAFLLSSSPEPLDQFQPENFGERALKFVQTKGQNTHLRGDNKELLRFVVVCW